MKFILGKKLEMSQVFHDDGRVTPVTVIEAGPCPIIEIKTRQRDGYAAVQLGFGEKKHITKALAGHLQKIQNSKFKKKNLRWFREVRVASEELSGITLGDEV